MGKRAWAKVILQNRSVIYSLAKEGIGTYRAAKKRKRQNNVEAAGTAAT